MISSALLTGWKAASLISGFGCRCAMLGSRNSAADLHHVKTRMPRSQTRTKWQVIQRKRFGIRFLPRRGSDVSD